MPLVTITGIPCSGKSTVAKNIKEHLEKSQKKVIIVSEDELLEQNEMDKNNNATSVYVAPPLKDTNNIEVSN